MRFVLSSGHGKYVRGAKGYLDEVDEARLVVEQTAKVLREIGDEVVTFHDDTSRSQSENLNTIVNFHNKQTRDYDVSVHFNAYQTTSAPRGCEVLYVSQKDLSAKVSAAIAKAGSFINRGPKYRSDLTFLQKTTKPAILIETCFVDSLADADLYRNRFDAICIAIAESLSGKVVSEKPPQPVEPEPPPVDPSPGPAIVSVAIDAPDHVEVSISLNGELIK
jgi:N-acetylmuramoyl-L-alanine amidase